MKENIKVLILEDLSSDAELAERELKTVLNNYKTVVVDTEQDFIKALENVKPDLIISDYKLPTFDGMKALQITRKKEEYIPFIILTGSMNEETAVECMKAGADDYVIKEHIKRLGSSIINALDKKRIRQERKQAEEALRESEMKFRNLAESTLTGIGMYQNDHWIYVNPAAEKITGYTFDELKQMKFWEFVAPEYVNIIKERGKARQQGKPATSGYEFKIITKQGTEKWVILTGNTVELTSGKAGLISIDDITKRKQTEDKLIKSEERFRKMFKNHGAIMFLIDPESGQIVDANHAAQVFYGYSHQELCALKIHDINQLSKVEVDKEIQNIKNKLRNTFILPHKLKNGQIRTVEVRSTPIEINNKKILFSIIQDITERKQAEAELTKLSTAVTQSPSIIAITDTDGKLEYVNPKFTKITGYSQEELIGQNLRILKSEEHSDKMYKELWETISSGKTWRGEFHNKKKSGELYWEMAYISPIFDAKGKIINYLKDSEDITERKQAEENFKHSIDDSPLGIRIVTQNGKTIYVNKVLLDIYEYSSPDEFLNTKVIDRYTEKSYQEHLERKKIRQAGGDVSDYEISIRRKNGEIRHIQVWRKAVIWNREKHFQVINQDITELKRLTTDLIRAKEKAEESDRLKSAFLANMSHEIRTPMNGILGFTRLLKKPQLTGDEKYEFIQFIEKSGKRMLNTINNIMDISKIEASQVKVVKSEILIDNLLKEHHKLFYNEAKSKGLDLIYKSSLNHSKARIITDKHKLEGILNNLLNNAIKFTNSGSITFGFSLKNKNFVEFYVKDTGIGIPANRMEAIFNRFEQADLSDTRVFEGSGLGLAISKSYVKMLGGEIGVRSKEGSGSTFTFTIPYQKQN